MKLIHQRNSLTSYQVALLQTCKAIHCELHDVTCRREEAQIAQGPIFVFDHHETNETEITTFPLKLQSDQSILNTPATVNTDPNILYYYERILNISGKRPREERPKLRPYVTNAMIKIRSSQSALIIFLIHQPAPPAWDNGELALGDAPCPLDIEFSRFLNIKPSDNFQFKIMFVAKEDNRLYLQFVEHYSNHPQWWWWTKDEAV
jgi:hypothetical protein